MCEQNYHGVVRCALGWACWKTYVGRPEKDVPRITAMTVLGNGLNAARQLDDALSVKEAELAMLRRLGASEEHMLAVQSNLAMSYEQLGKHEQTLRMRQDVYFGRLKLLGEEHVETIRAANNCAFSLTDLKRFEEAKALMCTSIPVARRVLGESHELTLRIRLGYAQTLYGDPGATLDDLSLIHI